MNAEIPLKEEPQSGGVSIALLLIAFCLCITAASYLKFSINNARINYKAIDHQRARILAESALDAGESQLCQIIQKAEFGLLSGNVQSHLNNAAKVVKPTFSGDDSSYVVEIFSLTLQGTGSFIPTIVDGRLREHLDATLTTGVRNTKTGARAACSEVVRITRLPFLRYAIFFDGWLELHPGPAMVVNGDIRSNSQIEFWAKNSLQIEGTVQCPGPLNIIKSDEPDNYSTETRKSDAAKLIQVAVGDGKFESFFQDDKILDSDNQGWASQSKSVWEGRVEAGSEVVELNPPIGEGVDNHALIEPQLPTDSGQLKYEKLAHKADLYIRVDKYGVVKVTVAGKTDTVKPKHYATPSGAKDENGVYPVSNNRWIDVHNNYYDPRESEAAYLNGADNADPQRMQIVDVYMDQLVTKHPGTSIVYIEVEDPEMDTLKPAVRLRNGADLTVAGNSTGLSIASHRTMYVEGDFNTGAKIPVLIAADNLTVLSNAWDDKNSQEITPRKPATKTSLNAAVMIGYADPNNLAGNNGTEFTGGAHNLVRFRENWKGVDYEFKGSYLSLWTALDSHCLISGTTYKPPIRDITYDTAFKDTTPPGMPVGYSEPEVLFWKELGWDAAVESLKGN